MYLTHYKIKKQKEQHDSSILPKILPKRTKFVSCASVKKRKERNHVLREYKKAKRKETFEPGKCTGKKEKSSPSFCEEKRIHLL